MSEKGLNTVKVAIVGTGMAGLACAGVMATAGARVTLFDKSRGYGGRVASRRREGFAFDHGLPAFDPVARESVEALEGLAEWGERGTVAAPRMNALPRAIGERYESRMGVAVTGIDADDLTLTDADGGRHGGFSRVVVAVPAPQAGLLLGGVGAGSDIVDMEPEGGPLRRIIRDDAKPGHPAEMPCWVAHAQEGWAVENLEWGMEDVAAELVRAFGDATGIDVAGAGYVAAHRWRYCNPRAVVEATHVLSPSGRIGTCGDWCGADRSGGDARAAWRSGEALGRAMAR